MMQRRTKLVLIGTLSWSTALVTLAFLLPSRHPVPGEGDRAPGGAQVASPGPGGPASLVAPSGPPSLPREEAPAAPPAPDCAEALAELSEALAAAEIQVRILDERLHECELAAALGPPHGTTARWFRERARTKAAEPTLSDLYNLRETLATFEGVHLTIEEGEWILESLKNKTLGTTYLGVPYYDEALLLYLGPDRVASEVEPELLEELKAEFEEEGYFN